MKKLTVLVLVLMMALAVVPGVALADATITVGAGETYTTIQAAVNSITSAGTYEIVVKSSYVCGKETVDIIQKEGINIIITGETGAVFDGNIRIDGEGRSAGTDYVTIQGLSFDWSTGLTATVYGIDLVRIRTTGSIYSYSHNVTIQNCAFVGDGIVFAVQAGKAGGNTAYNTKVLNCTFDKVKCVVQARCNTLTIEGITATNCGGGLSINNSTDITIKNSSIIVTDPIKEALKVGENGGLTDFINLVIENCTLSCVGGNAVIFRLSSKGSASISGSDIIGSIQNLSTNQVDLVMDNTFVQGSMIGQANYKTCTITSARTSMKNKDSEVKANADVAYIVVIPASVDFGTISKSMGVQSRDFEVKVQDALLDDGAKITVANTTADMVMKDKNGTGTKTLAFTLAPDLFEFTYAALTDGIETITSSVACTPADLTAAGSYKGVMSFTITYVP